MPATADNALKLADYIREHGLLQNDLFGDALTRQLDIGASAFHVVEGHTPPEFYSPRLSDAANAINIIEASAGTMQLLAAIARVVPAPQRVTRLRDGHEVSDYLDTVTAWTTEGIPVGSPAPSVSEVIKVILRAADHADQAAAA